MALALAIGAGCCNKAAGSDKEPAASTSVVSADPAFALVYKGDFAGAQKVLDKQIKSGSAPTELTELSKVLGEYKALQAKRDIARRANYESELKELAKYRNPAAYKVKDANGAKDPNGIKDINDVNDPNGLFSALMVVVKAHEVADANQKKELLANPFVQEIINKSLARCGKYEKQGNWLEALVGCYGKLKMLYEDNKSYADYVDTLTDKELVKLSLTDSPCENRDLRYKGVDKEMFVRTVKGLDLNYVAILNYIDMANKAIKRAQLLAEVVRTVPELQKQFLGALDQAKFAAWSHGLDEINSQVASSPLGITKDKFLSIYDQILELNSRTINLPQEVLIVHLSEASLAALDPYTNLIWPQQVEEFKKNMTNEFSGIGVEITKAEGPLKIASLLPDTPAYTSGLDAGDEIVAVDGTSTKDMPIGCAVKMITGPANTKVNLTIRRKDEQKTTEFVIKRGKILVPTVRGWQRQGDGEWNYMIDEQASIGYIHVTSFSEKTDTDFEDVLAKLEAKGLKGLIIDLRYNPGGYLETAIKMVDKFVSEGLIVRTQPRFGWATYASAKKEGTHPNYPIAILINEGSASASEIMAGALKDPMHKRAILVGTRTYGKGSVQTIGSTGDGAQLKYTMAYYHLPSGQRVEGRSEMEKLNRKDWGVGPDVDVELTNEELKKMIDYQRDNDVLVKAGHKNGEEGLKKHGAKDMLEADPQLAIADLVIKSKLIETKIVAKSK